MRAGKEQARRPAPAPRVTRSCQPPLRQGLLHTQAMRLTARVRLAWRAGLGWHGVGVERAAKEGGAQQQGLPLARASTRTPTPCSRAMPPHPVPLRTLRPHLKMRASTLSCSSVRDICSSAPSSCPPGAAESSRLGTTCVPPGEGWLGAWMRRVFAVGEVGGGLWAWMWRVVLEAGQVGGGCICKEGGRLSWHQEGAA